MPASSFTSELIIDPAVILAVSSLAAVLVNPISPTTSAFSLLCAEPLNISSCPDRPPPVPVIVTSPISLSSSVLLST